MKRLLMTGLALAAILSHAEVMDRGGVSLDLNKARLTPEKVTGENYLTPNDSPLNARSDRWGWKSGFNFQTSDPLLRKDLLAKTGAFFKSEVVGNTLKIQTDSRLACFRDNRGEPTATNAIYRTLKIPGSGRYILDFTASGELDRSPGYQRGRYIVSFLDANGSNRVGKDAAGEITLFTAPIPQSVVLTVPENCRTVRLAFFIYGIGQMEISKISLRKAALEPEISVFIHPQAHTGNIFVVPSERPALLYFMQNNTAGLKLENPELRLKLPSGFEVIGATVNLDAPCRDGEEWVIPLGRARIVKTDYWAGPIVIRAAASPGPALLPAEYYIRNGGKNGTVKKFQFKVAPAPVGAQPKKFLTGFFSTSLHRFNDPLMRELAAFYRECGFNGVKGSYVGAMSKIYQDAGFKTAIWPTSPGPSDGYDMGTPDKPESVRYRLADGSFLPAHRNKWMICPEEAASRGEHYRTFVAEKLQDIAKREKNYFFISNWEPQDAFRGCFCERCREAFIRDTGLPAAEVRAAWPAMILDKWRSQWIAFRSRQHGRLLGNVENDVVAAGTGAHFMPGVVCEAVREPTWQLYNQYGSPDYIEKVRWINAWGPYLYYDMCQTYDQQTGIQLKAFFSARQVKDFLAKRIPDPAKRPKVIAFPQQLQCFYWITTPEAPAFETLSYFLNGWEGSMLYFFPMASDNRTFQAMAATNNVIAATEDIVFGGTRLPDPKVEAATPMPKSYFFGGNDYKYPELTQAELLQSVAWRKGERTLIAVGNFWQKGECFFTLKVDGLKATDSYVVFLPSQKAVFTNDNGKFFTGAELAKGVLLQVGALRWNLYEIYPYRKGMTLPGVRVDQNMVQKTMAARLPDIRKSLDFELKEAAKLKALRSADEVPDYSGLKNLKGDGIEAKYEDGVYTFTSPDQKLTVDLKHGGKIASWLYLGTQIVAVHPEFGLGIEGAWEPRPFMLKSPVRVTSLSKEKNALVLEMERRISHSESKFFEGVTIRKKLRISDGEVKQTSTIVNSTGDSQSFAFRWHNMILFPEFEYQTVKGPLHLKRDYGIRAFKRSSRSGTFLIQGKQRPAILISSPAVTFFDPAKHLEFKVTVAPAADFDAFVMWDGSTPAPSFEPVFREHTLNAGLSASYEITFRIQKGRVK